MITISQGNYLHKPIVDPRDSDRFCTCRNPPWITPTDPVDGIPPLLARIGRYLGINLILLLIDLYQSAKQGVCSLNLVRWKRKSSRWIQEHGTTLLIPNLVGLGQCRKYS